jgi:hypothetical protein
MTSEKRRPSKAAHFLRLFDCWIFVTVDAPRFCFGHAAAAAVIENCFRKHGRAHEAFTFAALIGFLQLTGDE